LLCFVSVLASVVAEAGADAWLRDGLARALEANERWEQLAAEFREENARLRAENERLREENARLRERDVQREAELERVNAELAVLRRRPVVGAGPAGCGRGWRRGRGRGPPRRG
jgi:cell shape-determining protein MreC